MITDANKKDEIDNYLNNGLTIIKDLTSNVFWFCLVSKTGIAKIDSISSVLVNRFDLPFTSKEL